MHAETLGVGIIGSGYWGPKVIRNFHEAPNTRVSMVADLDQERLDRIGDTFPSIALTTNFEDFRNADVDAVVIATPVSTHYTIARWALEAGMHVLVEKPLAHGVEHAEHLAELATHRQRTLMVGHVFEYNPAVECLRELVQNGALGEIMYVDMIRATLGLFQRDTNVIWDLAPHDFSILRFVLGADPKWISAQGTSYIRQGIEDVAYITAEYPEGIRAHIRVSWLEPRKQRQMMIVGSKQMVVYDDTEPVEKIRIFDVGVDREPGDLTGAGKLTYRYGDIHSPRLPQIEPLQAECRHFADSILEGTVPRSGPEDGVNVVRALSAAHESLRKNGQRVDF